MKFRKVLIVQYKKPVYVDLSEFLFAYRMKRINFTQREC